MSTPFPAVAGNGWDQFDTEPLSWVMGEIREALARSKTALIDTVGKDADSQSTLLRHAKTYLHQAHGALQIVDIGGVALITHAVEELLERMAGGSLAVSEQHVKAICDAYQAFIEYLEELVSGAQTQPVRLFPYYKALLEIGGASRIHPADLFFPNTDMHFPAELMATVPEAGSSASVDYARLRQRFEKALLGLLKKSGALAGSEAVSAIKDIIAEVERAQSTPSTRQFWHVMHVYAGLACDGNAGSELYVKQLFGKINLHIRSMAGGGSATSERLLRDALFFIAQSTSSAPNIRKLKGLYRLEGMVPADYETPRYGRVDVVALGLAKEALAQAKSMWNRAAGGDGKSLANFEAEMAKLAEAAIGLNTPSLSNLIVELSGIARVTTGSAPSETLYLEIATSLLFIENALDQITRLADDFPQRADALTARLLSLVAGEAPLARADWLDDLNRKAQERQTVTALAVEMKSSLRHVEKLLDEYFIDTSTHSALGEIDPVLYQIGGALAILEQEDAARAVEHTRKAVQGFVEAGPESIDEGERRLALQNVAQNISALGFFIEMLPQHPDSAKNRFAFDAESGIFRANLLENPSPPSFDLSDFEDGKLVEPFVSLPEELDINAGMPPESPVEPQVEPSVVTAPVAAAPIAAPANAASTSDEAIDAELLEIFMSEAVEVLSFVKASIPESRGDCHNQDLLATLRRSFHTLKGSGRMVGLTSFASAAGSVEQVLNLWLSEERSGTSDLYTLLDKAELELSAWVEEITAFGHSSRNPSPLVHAAEGVKAGGPFHFEESVPVAADPVVPSIEQDEPVLETVTLELPTKTAVESDPVVEQSTAEFIESDIVLPEQVSPDEINGSLEVEETGLPSLELPSADVDEQLTEALQLPEEQPVLTIGDAEVIDEPAPDGEGTSDERPEEAIEFVEQPHSEESALEDAGAQVFTATFAGESNTRPALKLAGESASVIEFPRNIAPPIIDDNIKRIGDLEIGVPLYNIYLAETDEIVRLLAQDFSEWRHEPHRHVSTYAIHASHSLAGSSATVGFQPLQKVAHALEMVLQSLGRRHVLLNPEEFDTLDLCVERQKRMLQRFAAGEMPEYEPKLVQRLAQLQDDIVARAAIKYDADNDPEITGVYVDRLDGNDVSIDELGPGSDGLAVGPGQAAQASGESAFEQKDATSLIECEEQLSVSSIKQSDEGQAVTELSKSASPAAMQDEAGGKLPVSVVETTPESVAPDSAASETAELAMPAEPIAAGQVSPSPELATAADQRYATEVDALVDPALVAVNDEIDPDLLPVFLEEGRDLLPQIGQTLQAWQESPGNSSLAQSILRLLHTVKGSARMAGAMKLGQHTHDMESRIENMVLAGALSSMSFEDLLARHDTSMQLFEILQNPDAAKNAVLAPVAPSVPSAELAVQLPAAKRAEPVAQEVAQPAQGASVPMLRVRADILDRLVNQAGEVSIARSKLETEVETLRQSLSELTDNMTRLRSQLREVEMQAESQITSRMTHANDREFDPLEFDRFTRLQELTRMMAESVDDIASVQDNLLRTVDGATVDLASQARLTRDLQQDLMRVRMVPFASISERLYRVTRQAAKEVEKRVNLDIKGTSVTIDRGVLEKMAGPFEHLLRNSIAHGIESRAERLQAGKSEAGELLVEIRQEGNEVVIQFRDDGRGLDLGRIREKAIASGLLEEGKEVSDEEVADFIFQPGFSTAKSVTTLAGRGIGMDVVRSEAAALGGRVDIVSEPGKGARFTIHLPLTLAVTQVVLLSTGGETYAVPSNLVEQVQQLKSNSLALAYNEGAVHWQGNRVGLHYLSSLLGDAKATPVTQQYSPVMILNSGNERIAVHVDFVLGNREVVVKNIGPQLARMAGIAGATVLGSGDIVLILNPVALAQRGLQEKALPRALAQDKEHEAKEELGAVADLAGDTPVADNIPVLQEAVAIEPVQGLRKKHIVMVVDDSLTVRRVTQRFLVREGYQVVLAKDGVDALEQLQAITPDVMLVDIEMPRMDGFDLTRNVRSDERIRHIPVIMITSRTADKHRNYAMELGVNKYYGKPFQEEELLKAITSFVQSEVVLA